MPILLYGLEMVHVSHTNMHTLQPTWNAALYNIFKLKNLSNLYYLQYCPDILLINYARNMRKLSVLHKQSFHHMAVVNPQFLLIGCKEFDVLCKTYSVTHPDGQTRPLVWNGFLCYLASL